MPVDARIALGYQPPQIESPMNRLGRFMELESAQRQNALYERQQAELMRKQQQEAAINAAYSNALTPEGRLDEGKLSNYLAQANAGSAIPGAMEALGKGREALSKASSAEFELARSNQSFYNKAMGALARRKNLTKADVISAGQMLADAGYVSRDIVERGAASLPDDPDELRARLNEGVASQLTAEQMLTVFAPKPTAIDTNGAVLMRDMNPNSPTYGKLISRDAKTMSPGERARLLEDQRQFNATETREAAKLPEGAKPPAGYEYAPDGSLRFIKGGPADPDVIAARKRAEAAPATEARAKAAQQGVNTVNASLLELRSAYESLKNKGAIPSEALASMGPSGIAANLGAYVAASERGQAVGRAFGSEAQGDRDVIRAANMRLASAIARATGQTSQQLNSNVELQLALKSLGDPQSSYESNMRILDYLDRFVRENYAGDATGAATSGASGVTSSGTRYTREE